MNENESRNSARPLTSSTAQGLSGTVRVPGDKSISHRALMLGALARGETSIEGLLESEDVLGTAAALRDLGAPVSQGAEGGWCVRGRGYGGLAEPAGVLDMGNSGTGTRLMMGIAAAHGFTTFFTGDASLVGRPMQRVISPLTEMGAHFLARSGGRLPLAVTGRLPLLPIEHVMPVASAQVKSAILLAAMSAPGSTSVIEPLATRDHTENLLRFFGAEVQIEPLSGGGRRVSLLGEQELAGARIIVPGDPSSAAFLAVAAAITPDSDITIARVGINPLRDGLFITLQEMGANLEMTNIRDEGGELVADVRVRAGALYGVDVPMGRAPAMIDEYPVLAVAAAFASGRTVMRGIGELRIKESDRIDAMVSGLRACGVTVEEHDDGLTVTGGGVPGPEKGAVIETKLDHRIAMSFLVLGMAAGRPVTVDDGRVIETSFPGFAKLMNGIGASIVAPDET